MSEIRCAEETHRMPETSRPILQPFGEQDHEDVYRRLSQKNRKGNLGSIRTPGACGDDRTAAKRNLAESRCFRRFSRRMAFAATGDTFRTKRIEDYITVSLIGNVGTQVLSNRSRPFIRNLVRSFLNGIIFFAIYEKG